MAPSETAFILPFLDSDPDNINLVALLAKFHKAEAALDGPEVQRIPYFRWQGSISENHARQLHSIVDHACARSGNAPETIAVAAGILMRLTSDQPAAVQILHPLVPKLLDTCRNQTILFELGNIFRALPNWPLLQQIARAAIEEFSEKQWQANIVCDWLILANYRLLVKKFEANSLCDDDIELLETDINHLAEKIGENTKNVAFYRSLALTLRNQIEDAVTWTLKAQKLPGKILVLFRRLESFIPLSALERQPSANYTALEESVVHHFNHAAPDAGVLLVSVDEQYFKLYHEKLLESFAYWNPDGLIHIHCIDFEPEPNQLSGLEKNYGLRINYSIDKRPELSGAPNLYAGYCAGARYLYLPRYLEQYGKVAISDIDGVIRVPLSDLWSDGNRAVHLTSKLVSTEWTSTRLLWEAIAAGSFAIADAPANRDFAWILANYLADQITLCRDKRLRLFYTDQIGLLLAFVASKDTCYFRPLAGLFTQQGRWKLVGAGDAKTSFQNAFNYKKPLKDT